MTNNSRGKLAQLLPVIAVMISLFGGSVYAQGPQSVRLTGIVRSARTQRPLSGATIRLIGTTLGTSTNTDGAFRLLLKAGTYKLLFTFIGFDPDTINVELASNDTTVNVVLIQSVVSLPEVVVYPLSRNPADEIIRRAIGAKTRWLAKLHAYEFDAYTKTVLRVVENKEAADTTIAGILETQTKGYWKAPDSYIEVVTAKRQTANFSSAQNVFTAGRVLNFNDDIVRIDRFSIPGPISPDAFDHYNFSILDTLYQGDIRIFRINVEPKDEASPLFEGHIDIADNVYSLVQVRLGLSHPNALEPLQDVVYDEQFADYNNLYWLPIELRTTFSVKFVVPPVPRVFISNTSVLYDYTINPVFPAGFFERELTSASTVNPEKDSTAWLNKQILPLTHQERLAYVRLDSLTRNLPFYWKAFLSLTQLLGQSQPSAPSFFTSFSDFYHFDRIEGSYLGVGLMSSTLLKRTKLTAIGGYGFSDKMWKYDFGARYELPFSGGLDVGGDIFRRLANREEENIYSRFEVTLGTLLYKDDYRDYYLSKGWHGFARLRLNSSLKVGIRYADDEETSVHNNTNYSIFYKEYSYRPNPTITDGRMRSVELTLDLDSRRYYDTGMSMQSDEGTNYWVGDASMEVSSPRYLNSSFSFDRIHFSLLRHQMTFASGYLNLWAIGGTAIGRLPVQRLFEIQATYGGYAEDQVLSTLSTRRILSDRAVVVGIEHDFPSTLFRWSTIPIVKDIWFDVTLFAHGAAARGFSPMGEAGFGLVNIIPFIRTDFTWGIAGLCSGFAWTLETTLNL